MKLALKFISMSLVTTILFAFTFSSFAFAKTESQPELSARQDQAEKALKDLKKIKKIDIKDVKETSKKKEFKLVLDDEENLITYDKEAGELYVDGELAVTDIKFEEMSTVGVQEEASVSSVNSTNFVTAASPNSYVIGTDYSSGIWTNTGYKSGSFNVITVTVAAVAGTIALILTKKPSYSALSSAAGAVLSALFVVDQYTVLWGMYSYKDTKKAFYKDSLNLYNYKGRTYTNMICNITHYWGVV